MPEAGILPGQLVLRFEKRMLHSVLQLHSELARNIHASWEPPFESVVQGHLFEFRNTMAEIITRFHVAAAELGVNHILQASARKDFKDTMAEVQRLLGRYSYNQALLIEETMRSHIIKALESGKSRDEVLSDIKGIINNRDRIERIARTEIHTAIERGMWVAASLLGIRVRKTWISREDAVVRPAHAAAHGQTVEVLDPFVVGGENLMHPGDSNASAKNRINCRCTTNYRIG